MRTVSAEAVAAATAACPRFEQLLSQLRMLAADTEVRGGGDSGDTKARSAPCVGIIFQPYGHDVRPAASPSNILLCSNYFVSALPVGINCVQTGASRNFTSPKNITESKPQTDIWR